MTQHFDVCVSGAGPVGGTLACRLAAAGLSVAVVDRAALPPMEAPAFDGRAYAVAATSRDLLADAGLWDALPLPACPIHDIRVTDGAVGRRPSRLALRFDHRDAGRPFGHMVEARALRVALNDRLNAVPGIALMAPAAASFERDARGVRAVVSPGPHGPERRFTCALLVAAEGRDSALRRQAGIGVTRIPYRQAGLVCALAHELPHRNTALEHFLPGGPLAQLPMCGTGDAPHVSAIVWTDAPDVIERAMAMPDADFGRQVAARLGDHLGAVRPVGRRWRYPLSAMHAHRYADTRLALVGDAAHGIHPIAGQGLNLGFRDVAALAALVAGAASAGRDPGAPALLRRYQRARRPANLAMLAVTDGLDRLFGNDAPLLRAARDLGLGAVERMPRLKGLFMRQAMGV